MALTLIVEDGTIVAGANSYVDPTASVAVDFFDAHLFATAWTGAVADDRTKACIMATRYVDQLILWKGVPVENNQPLSWPRDQVLLKGQTEYLADDAIPLDIVHAVLETANAFLVGDRVSDTGKSAGVSAISLGQGALDLTFQQPDPQHNLPIIPKQVMILLEKYGASRESGFRQIPTSR